MIVRPSPTPVALRVADVSLFCKRLRQPLVAKTGTELPRSLGNGISRNTLRSFSATCRVNIVATNGQTYGALNMKGFTSEKPTLFIDGRFRAKMAGNARPLALFH